jgi:methionyl-tRNA formyltransferase
MKVVFAGTPAFAATALEAILAAGHVVPLVLTQPDRPSGRGMKVEPGPVKRVALGAGIPVLQPSSLKREPDVVTTLAATPHDVMVVAAYGLILPQAVLDIPPRGCLNIHASLLPRWRGAAPIQRAIEAGDSETGVCIMQMDAGLDTGAVLLEKRIPIAPDINAARLTDRLAALGGEAIVEALARLDTLHALAQPTEGVTYAAKIDKAEAQIDFRQPASVLARKVRAYDPFPGAGTHEGTRAFKIWKAHAEPGAAAPGTVVRADASAVAIACGDGLLVATELQRPGGKRLPAREFLAGFPLPVGAVCGVASAD